MSNVDQALSADDTLKDDTPKIELSTPEREAFAQAIQSAYYNPSVFAQFVFYGLGVKLDDIAEPGTLPARVMALVQWAESEGRTDDLVRVACERKPGNPKLRSFRQRYLSSAQRQVTHEALERLTSSAIQLKNPVEWRDRMARAEACVCRVLISGKPAGTGFLAGPGHVFTNYHVTEGRAGERVQVEFGFRVNADGVEEPGQRYDVTGPALFEARYSAVDLQSPKAAVPSPDEIDIVVLPVGGEPERAAVDGHSRGTITPAPAPRLAPGDFITIIQHPDGASLKFAYDEVLGLNANQTRVTYKVQTLPGSSGSPCFDSDWRLVAIHHGSDPRTGLPLGAYNEGIPITAIRAKLPADLLARLGWPARSSHG